MLPVHDIKTLEVCDVKTYQSAISNRYQPMIWKKTLPVLDIKLYQPVNQSNSKSFFLKNFKFISKRLYSKGYQIFLSNFQTIAYAYDIKTLLTYGIKRLPAYDIKTLPTCEPIRVWIIPSKMFVFLLKMTIFIFYIWHVLKYYLSNWISFKYVCEVFKRIADSR